MNADTLPAFKPYEGNDPYIFVSYSHKDSALVFPILQKLHEQGLRIWYDMGIDPGSEWPEEIAAHLIDCGLFLLFMSPEAAESHNVRREITMAIDKKKPLMNVILKETELQPGLQLQLNLIQYISYTSRDIEPFDDFISRLSGTLIKKNPDIAGKYIPEQPEPVPMPQSMPVPQYQMQSSSAFRPAVLIPVALVLVALIVAAVILIVHFSGSSINSGVDTADTPAHSADSGNVTESAETPAVTPGSGSSQGGDASVVISGSTCYVTLSGSGSLQFTNIFADKITMPAMVTRLNTDYAVIGSDGIISNYAANQRNLPGNIDPGCAIIVSLHDSSQSADFYFPAELLDTAITVHAFETRAVSSITFDGTGSLELTNISEDTANMPINLGLRRIDYVIYDAGNNVTAYNSNTTSREKIAPGSRALISINDSSDPITFYYPTQLLDVRYNIAQLPQQALHYVVLEGDGQVAFKNITSENADMPKSSGITRRNYTVYDADGEITESNENASNNGNRLAGGSEIVISLVDSSQSITYYFPASMLDTVYSVSGGRSS